MPLELAGPWPPEIDVPQVGFKEPLDHHEAYWLYGYDPASGIGHYLYLTAEKDDVLLRPDTGSGRCPRPGRSRRASGPRDGRGVL